MAGDVLALSGVTMDFGGVRAVDHLSLTVPAGSVTALIGPNGAGKTTVFNCITGLYKPTKGSILATRPGGVARELSGLSPDRITRAGVARTFQNIRIFPRMTVLENVMVGRHGRSRAGFLDAILRTRSTRSEETEIVEASHGFVVEVGLGGWVNEIAGRLPYGAQRRLEIARALATEPFLLLLDEPAAGMNPRETGELDELICRICEELRVAVLLIEHDMKLVMNLSHRIVVMDHGRGIAAGTPAEVRSDPRVIEAYLGEETC